MSKKKEVKQDLFYRLEEMCDSMEESLRNVEEVKNQQLGLIEIIEKSDKAKDYEKFVKTLKTQIEQEDKQYETLKARTNSLKELLFGEKNDIITPRSAINTLLYVLNVFGE